MRLGDAMLCRHGVMPDRCVDCLRQRVAELEKENEIIRKQNLGHCERIHAAHEVIAKFAERKDNLTGGDHAIQSE